MTIFAAHYWAKQYLTLLIKKSQLRFLRVQFSKCTGVCVRAEGDFDLRVHRMVQRKIEDNASERTRRGRRQEIANSRDRDIYGSTALSANAYGRRRTHLIVMVHAQSRYSARVESRNGRSR